MLFTNSKCSIKYQNCPLFSNLTESLKITTLEVDSAKRIILIKTMPFNECTSFSGIFQEFFNNVQERLGQFLTLIFMLNPRKYTSSIY